MKALNEIERDITPVSQQEKKEITQVVKVADGIEIDLGRRRMLRVNGESVPIASNELNLLIFLRMNLGKAVPKKTIIDPVFGPESNATIYDLDNLISRLRRKLSVGPDGPIRVIPRKGVLLITQEMEEEEKRSGKFLR